MLGTLPDNVEVRTFAARAACLEKNGDAAREHASKLPAGKAPVAVCTKQGIDLSGKKAGEPTPDPPADWNKEVGDAMMLGDYKEALDLALLVLAKTPNEQHALYIVTAASCMLEDAATARKYAARLDANGLAKAKRWACDKVKIDLSTK